jgi:hypothetical protein
MKPNRTKRGMILGIIVLMLILLSVFIFSYHQVVTHRNRQAHHERIVEAINRVSYAGANLFADFLSSGPGNDERLRSCVPQLYSDDPVPADGRIQGVNAQNPFLQQVALDLNEYFKQLEGFRQSPSECPQCVDLSLSFDQVKNIIPANHPSAGLGRDPVEKQGIAVIVCTVEYQGLIRKAEIRRQFRVVSLVPGPYCRFSLFAPYTPSRDSFNTVGVQFSPENPTEEIDPTYTPSGSPHFSGVLKIFNGTDSYVPPGPPDAEKDLENRGWIFIGPGRDPSGEDIILKIPTGFTRLGGHFLFSRPLTTPKVTSPGDFVKNVACELFNDPDLALQYSGFDFIKLQGTYQGFYTQFPGVSEGAAGQQIYPGLSSIHDCATTWLFPFGDVDNPSRTLIVGKVFAGFLKYFGLNGAKGGIPDKKAIVPPYNPDDPAFPRNFAADGPKLKDIFPSDVLYEKYRPANFSMSNIAFNSLFDTLSYPMDRPGSNQGFPPFGRLGYCPILDWNPALAQAPALVPEGSTMKQAGGIHPTKMNILFAKAPGVTPDNTYFSGDLTNFTLDAQSPIFQRISHEIDLTGCKDTAEESKRFQSLLFTKYSNVTPQMDHQPASNGTWYIPRRSGIFLIKRRSGAGYPLVLPGPIALAQSLIFLVDNGDIEIPDTVLSSLDQQTNGAPLCLCSIIALQGNIRIGTDKEIDAFLVALKKGFGESSQGGRILSANSQVTSLKVFGGLAAWEIGRYPGKTTKNTMEDFTAGGVLKYNPWFNPGKPEVYGQSRSFLLEDRNRATILSGGAS